MVYKSIIKNWFLTGLKPTQAQFHATWDSFWHKNEQIPVENVDGLQAVLNDKADTEVLDFHLTDDGAHAGLFNRSRIYLPGQLQIFKRAGFVNAAELEVGDVVIGIIENAKIEGVYLGGSATLLSSFNIINQVDF